jgi:signal transduction histidine kinase
MKVLRLLVWVIGAVLCTTLLVGVLRGDWPRSVDAKAAVLYPSALVVITLGLVVWARRPDSRTGILLTALPFAGVLADLAWIFPTSALGVTVGLAATQLAVPIIVHLVLSYPSGRLSSPIDRAFTLCTYVFALVYAVPLLLFYDPRAPDDPNVWEWPTHARPLTHIAWYEVGGLRHVLDAVELVLAVAFVALLIRKAMRATPSGRGVALPLILAGSLVAAQFAVQIGLYGEPASSWTSAEWFWIVTLATLALPVSLAAGLLWGRTARAAVADLVLELEHTPPSAVRDALARTLRDPSLELALWLPNRGSYADNDGRPVQLPTSGADRAVTVLGAPESPIAALVHDPALLERRALLDAASAAARLALENARLQAELRAQLDEVRASRARIVEAGDAERCRLERDLHDGAQQRLLGIRLALQLARGQLADGGAAVDELLAEADSEVVDALAELRTLARGIHPAILTDGGLAPALAGLARRAPVPVALTVVPERLPGPVEATVYFVASEALANIAKHAHASHAAIEVTRTDGRVAIEVSDDGIGRADAHGAGLRGLRDRVEALDGRLRVESSPGRGTRVRAALPCA